MKVKVRKNFSVYFEPYYVHKHVTIFDNRSINIISLSNSFITKYKDLNEWDIYVNSSFNKKIENAPENYKL